MTSQTTGHEALFNEIMEVIRDFFELEFDVPALSRTTREFLVAARDNIGLPTNASKRLKWLASLDDEIKFARRGVCQEHVQQAFAQAKSFIAECEDHRLRSAEGAA